METIHLKTVDPTSQELLRIAAKKGIPLNWDRYEKLQPQDGFLRLGLSCPFGCLQGPCRIDPFGRGPERGQCGMDRDVMVAAMLLRICLNGALAVCNDLGPAALKPTVSLPDAFKKSAAKAIGIDADQPLLTSEIFKTADLLQRPSAPCEFLLRQALVLSLLAVGLMRQKGFVKKNKDRSIQAGFGLLSGESVNVAFAGRPPFKLLDDLRSISARRSAIPVQLMTLGEWVIAGGKYLPIACSSGEAELLLSSHAVHLLVAGAGADPGVIEIARRMKLPVALADDRPGAAEILKSALQFHSRAPLPQTVFGSDTIGAARVSATMKQWTESFKNKTKTRYALVGGSDSLHHPLGYLPMELAKALQGAGVRVAGWGDAAVWMIKNGLTLTDDNDPVVILEPEQGPLQILADPDLAGKPKRISGILFTGSRDCRDLIFALGLALLGFNVAMADPIPYWGSSRVRDSLSKLLTAGRGRLTGFDHPAQPQDLLEWLGI